MVGDKSSYFVVFNRSHFVDSLRKALGQHSSSRQLTESAAVACVKLCKACTYINWEDNSVIFLLVQSIVMDLKVKRTIFWVNYRVMHVWRDWRTFISVFLAVCNFTLFSLRVFCLTLLSHSRGVRAARAPIVDLMIDCLCHVIASILVTTSILR